MMHNRAILTLAVFSICATAAAAPRKPNILVIVGDDMGYADIGAHGCKDIPTPHIDSLARNGVRCSSGYVTGPYCSPTRAALLTGRYQQRFGHEFNPGPPGPGNDAIGLSLDEKTMADRLAAAGYATGMVGKWHLGHVEKFHPLGRGFQEYFGFLGGAHAYFPTATATGPNAVLRGREPADEKQYLTDAFAREAADYVERHKADPFFLYLAFNAVHTPMHAEQKYLARVAPGLPERRRQYAAMMIAMDDAIGAVLAKLRESGLEEDTLVFFISDNGGPPGNSSDNTPLRGHKASTWEGGIRVPFLVQWKGKLPAGKVFDQPVAQIDILPTALAAAGVQQQPQWKLDGVDLVPHLTGKKESPPHEALCWRFGNQMAVRMGDWKLVRGRPNAGDGANRGAAAAARSTQPELFNLATDVGEKNDLSAKQPDKLRELQAAWERWNADNQPPAWPQPAAARRAARAARRAVTN